MTANTVTKLPLTARQQRASAAVARRATAEVRRRIAACSFVGTVALTLTGLSLMHLSKGIALVTGAPTWEALAMAIGIDLGFVALELAMLVETDPKRQHAAERWARPAIMGTLAFSALLNALAFTWAATGWMVYPAAALGLAVPAMVYAMTRVGSIMWMGK